MSKVNVVKGLLFRFGCQKVNEYLYDLGCEMLPDKQSNCISTDFCIEDQPSDIVETNYKMVMAAVNDGVFIYDINSQVIEFNDRWFNMLGYEPRELPHNFDTWKSLVHKYDLNSFEDGFRQMSNNCTEWEIEYRVRGKNGCWIWVSLHAEVIEYENGVPHLISGSQTNIQKRKLVEATIASQLYLSNLSQRCSVDELLSAFLDEAEKLTNSNIGFFHFLEKDQKTISLQAWSTNTTNTMCKAKDYKMHYDLDEAGVWVDCVRARKTVLHNDYESLPHKKGLPEGHAPVLRELVVPVFREGYIVAFFGLGNKPVCYNEGDIKAAETLADMAWDIVDRKMVEGELKEHHQRLEELVNERTSELNEKNEDLESAMARLRETQNQLIVYEKMEALRHLISGIAHEINTPLGAIGSSERVIYSHFQRIFNNINNLYECLSGPYGESVNQMIGQAIATEPESRYMSSREKREKRKEIEDILSGNGIAKSREMAHMLVDMRVVENIGSLIPMLKDDKVSGYLDVLRYALEIFQSCDTIEAAVKKASATINALNKYMRKSDRDKNIEEKKQKVDIKGSVEGVLPLFYNLTKQLESFEILYEEADMCVMAYPDELNQVWTNLLQNALFAVGGKGNIKLKSSIVDGYVVVEVIDDGCGMAEEVKKRMFEPLYTTKPEGKGIGLGMDIVQKIVKENHGGCIDVESEPGKGTTVSIWLPKILAAENES